MEPGKTSFFQALGVPTKIARGTIEITTDLKLVEAGGKVGASEATLLNMLNISPFTYGMKVIQVYEEGQAFSPDVLDIEESQLLKVFSSAIATITTISLAANYPTLPSIIHSLINAYKNTISVAIETDYSWEAIDELKDRIANPDAYASAAPAAAAVTEDAPAAAKEEEKKEESEAEESGDEGELSTRLNRQPSANVSQDSVVSSTKRRHDGTCLKNDCYAKPSPHTADLSSIENDTDRDHMISNFSTSFQPAFFSYFIQYSTRGARNANVSIHLFQATTPRCE
jgi:60s Acidic ribosomal protein/Insertion domain in 60S ribosomal protein L10P